MRACLPVCVYLHARASVGVFVHVFTSMAARMCSYICLCILCAYLYVFWAEACVFYYMKSVCTRLCDDA